MDHVTLGRTGITVNKNGFGALPIQRISKREAAKLLQKAFDNGITFFDTARFYTDSELKIGLALSRVRDEIFISSKTMCTDVSEFWEDLHTSLKNLETDYIDIYQFHNPDFCPKAEDKLYKAMLEAKSQGKIRHIGLTNHRLDIACEAALSGLYETIQYPISYLASDDEMNFVRQCSSFNIGILGMKALAGGLITNSAAAYAFMMQFPNTIPLWGIQREEELDEFISYQKSPPVLNYALQRTIDRDKANLSGDFCRGCGYCLPCPAGIDIPTCARMSLLLRRAPEAMNLNNETRKKMFMIDACVQCGQCKKNCPYGLDTPRLLRKNLEDYQMFVKDMLNKQH